MSSVYIIGVEGLRIHDILPSGWHNFDDSAAEGMLKSYNWTFEIETSELSDDKGFQYFLINMIKEIYWSFGIEHPSDKLLEAFFSEMKWGWIK